MTLVYHKSMKRFFQVFIVVFITTALVRIFVIDSFFVSGDSMSPLLQDGDYIFINKLAYRGDREPKRGDVVIVAPEKRNIVKRIIALPYERILIERGAVRIKTSREDEGNELIE